MQKTYLFWRKIRLLALIILLPAALTAQTEFIRGQVLENDGTGALVPVEQVAVYWQKSRKVVFTDELGMFKIPDKGENTLIFHYLSYEDDTVTIIDQKYVTVTFDDPLSEEVVEIRARERSTFVSTLEPVPTEILSRKELAKAACCNLSESFLTNSTVNVKQSDGVSGAKEIKMLGLGGKYTQISTERLPLIRGIGLAYGLDHTPGDWIENIRISKGAGSVANGYESLTGEIDIEMKKPENYNPLHLNLYANAFGRLEANAISTLPVGEKWSTGIFFHAANNSIAFDPDGDGFMNNPLTTRIALMNRWKFVGDNGWRFQTGIKLLGENRAGGDMNYRPFSGSPPNIYAVDIISANADTWFKTGWVHPFRTERSFGFQGSGFVHTLQTRFGRRNYDAEHVNTRAGFTYQDYVGSPIHKYRLGWNYMYEDFVERLNLEQENPKFNRQESVVGLFGEYTFEPNNDFTAVVGLRGDYHNMFGVLFTPRIHLKYSIKENTFLRISAGRGYRTPNRIAENLSYLATSRAFSFEDDLKQESAWTVGFSGLQNFKLGEKEWCVTLDAFRTQFTNQLIVDIEQADQIRFYNLDGQSFSNTLQIEFGGELIERLDLRLAYKFQDVRSTYDGVMRQVPFTPRDRGLVNLSWVTPNDRWQFDFTTAYTGPQRIPYNRNWPDDSDSDLYSPGFFTLYAQINHYFERLEVYLGGENLTNYRQQTPVILPNEPFGPNFDAARIWGPVMGANVYAGLRFDIEKD